MSPIALHFFAKVKMYGIYILLFNDLKDGTLHVSY